MKKHWFFLLICTLALASCQKAGKTVAGSYSYKTSATVQVDDETVNLPDEMGAMKIICREDGSLLLTMNQLNGAVLLADAEWDAERQMIVLQPFERVLKMNSLFTEDFDVTVSGQGEYLGETIVFSLSYDGQSQTGDATLVGDDIHMVAWK